MSLHLSLAAGVAALRSGDAAAAVDHLSRVATAPDWAENPGLTDIYARACSLLAQACLQAGELERADQWSRQALRLLRTLGDTEGQAEVRALQEEVRAALTGPRSADPHGARAALLGAADTERLLSGAADPQARAELLLQKANAEIDAGRAEQGVALAERALSEPGTESAARVRVLAWLTVARGAPERSEEAILAAHRVADLADDFNLVAAVSRAARLAGVALPHAISGGR